MTQVPSNAQEQAELQRLIETVVRCDVLQIADADIMQITDLSAAELAALRETKVFKEAYSAAAASKVEQASTLNDAWDRAEAMSLNTVLDTLEYTRDPDFALRAAVVANKAVRRGNSNERLITPVSETRVTINLNAAFVNRLQQAEAGTTKVINPKKQQDRMNVKAVENILGEPEKDAATLLSIGLAEFKGSLDV